MKSLLEDYAGERLENAADDANTCHHGSDDVSYEFLQAIQPAPDGHLVGGRLGPRPPAAEHHRGQRDDGLLVHPERRARFAAHLIGPSWHPSSRTGLSDQVRRVGDRQEDDRSNGDRAALERSKMHIKGSRSKSRTLDSSMNVGSLIYGLINVRTDGERILCATMSRTGRWMEAQRGEFAIPGHGDP